MEGSGFISGAFKTQRLTGGCEGLPPRNQDFALLASWRETLNTLILGLARMRHEIILIGFKTEDEWFEYRLQNDPRFLARIEAARQSLREGGGVPIEDADA